MTVTENLLADYRAATTLERTLTEEAAKMTDRRSELIGQLHTSGMSYPSIGAAVGLSGQRGQQLATR